MNTTQLKEKIIMMKNKSEKYDKLLVEYDTFINNYYNILYKNQELEATNYNLLDKISKLVAENDDFKEYSYTQKNQICLLNQEINSLEEQIEIYQTKYLEVSNEKDEYFDFSIDLKDRVTELQGFATLYHEKCAEINQLTSQISELKIENQELKKTQYVNHDLLKTVIDEIGTIEWDIVTNEDSIME